MLVAAGESAEFVGGALVCAGGRVIGAQQPVLCTLFFRSPPPCCAVPLNQCSSLSAVRKEAQTDELSLEGAVSEHYFRIRSLLYSRFAIV